MDINFKRKKLKEKEWKLEGIPKMESKWKNYSDKKI